MSQSKRLHQRAVRFDALKVHFDLGLRCYDAGDLYGVERHRAAVGMLPEGGALALEFLALRWRELWLQGHHEAALEVASEASRRYPADADTSMELADILRDLDRPEEALDTLMKAAQISTHDADLWYEIGLGAESLRRWDVRLDAFRNVWALEHDREPAKRLWLTEERFVEVATQTLERMPPVAKAALGNVVIFVDDYPEEWIFDTHVADPRVMGIFAGPDRATQLSTDYIASGPARIYLYRWNIERVCGSEEEAEEQVEITVLHEVGHYLGLDEEALDFRGLG